MCILFCLNPYEMLIRINNVRNVTRIVLIGKFKSSITHLLFFFFILCRPPFSIIFCFTLLFECWTQMDRNRYTTNYKHECNNFKSSKKYLPDSNLCVEWRQHFDCVPHVWVVQTTQYIRRTKTFVVNFQRRAYCIIRWHIP
jgi:hypothetical protein